MGTMRFDLTRNDYEKFIKDLRNKAKDPERTYHGKPVLPPPPQNPADAKNINIELRAQCPFSVIVRIRRHDLYLVGYQTEDGKWYEFRRDDGVHIIPGSQYLGFGENYSDMGGLGNLERIGYQPLNNAIINLAAGTGRSSFALRALAVMISESARFDKLLNIFAKQVRAYSDTKFEGWMVTLIHGWADLSYRLLREEGRGIDFGLPDEETSGRKNALTTDPKLGIVTAADALACLGLLLGRCLPSGYLSRRRRATNDIQVIEGQPLVEVFWVRIENDYNYPIDLYGNITVTDGLGSFFLYNRPRHNCEYIKRDDSVSLRGPYRSISLCQFFTISLDLKSREAIPMWGYDPSSSDGKVSKGSFSSDIFYLRPTDYHGNSLFRAINGENGLRAVVGYSIFGDAVQAKVDVVLINGDNEDPAEVYGILDASYDYSDHVQKKYCQTRLFNRPRSKCIKIRPEGSIPLSRYMVAVPTTTSLIIEADLRDRDPIVPDEIAQGAVTFRPKTHGKSDPVYITGKHGSIQVTVTWSALSGG